MKFADAINASPLALATDSIKRAVESMRSMKDGDIMCMGIGLTIEQGEALLDALARPEEANMPKPVLVNEPTEAAKRVWDAALEEAALYMQEQDCAHKCGVGAEIAEKIRSRKHERVPQERQPSE